MAFILNFNYKRNLSVRQNLSYLIIIDSFFVLQLLFFAFHLLGGAG